MSIRLMSAIFDSKTLGPTERLIMLALADHADDDGRCYPSILRLCDRTGLSERAVQTNIKKLSDAGYLSVHLGGGKGHANLYFVSPNPAGNAPRSKCTPQEMHPKPRSSCGQTPQQMHPNHQEPSIEPSLEPLCISPAESASEGPRPPRRKPEVPLPEDWVPSDRNISDAAARNFTRQEIDRHADQFRNYHLSKGSRFRDWDAAWRTWLGNARAFDRAAPRNAGPSGGHSSLLAGFQRAAFDG